MLSRKIYSFKNLFFFINVQSSSSIRLVMHISEFGSIWILCKLVFIWINQTINNSHDSCIAFNRASVVFDIFKHVTILYDRYTYLAVLLNRQQSDHLLLRFIFEAIKINWKLLNHSSSIWIKFHTLCCCCHLIQNEIPRSAPTHDS